MIVEAATGRLSSLWAGHLWHHTHLATLYPA